MSIIYYSLTIKTNRRVLLLLINYNGETKFFYSKEMVRKAKLPFTDQEYQSRLTKLRTTMSKNNLDMIILTSMHNIAYYTGFIYCSFGRPYGCVVTANKISTISANIDASQPWRRSHSDNVIYTDWKRDNFFKSNCFNYWKR